MCPELWSVMISKHRIWQVLTRVKVYVYGLGNKLYKPRCRKVAMIRSPPGQAIWGQNDLLDKEIVLNSPYSMSRMLVSVRQKRGKRKVLQTAEVGLLMNTHLTVGGWKSHCWSVTNKPNVFKSTAQKLEMPLVGYNLEPCNLSLLLGPLQLNVFSSLTPALNNISQSITSALTSLFFLHSLNNRVNQFNCGLCKNPCICLLMAHSVQPHILAHHYQPSHLLLSHELLIRRSRVSKHLLSTCYVPGTALYIRDTKKSQRHYLL